MNLSSTRNHLLLVASGQATPLQVPEGPMKTDDRNACRAGGTVQPTQDATRTLASEGALGNAAYRDAGCKASTAADEGRLGSSGRRSMDL
jgi:hypothetical protein